MRFLSALAVCGLMACAACAADDKKKDEAVREIDLKGVKVPGQKDGRWSDPTVIKSEDELKKVFGDDAAKAMKVDFAKEYLALFQWAGSGQDKLTHAVETKDGKTTVTTSFMPGRTKDLRQHAHLYALPAGAEWKAGK
jgi:hypothetical protein